MGVARGSRSRVQVWWRAVCSRPSVGQRPPTRKDLAAYFLQLFRTSAPPVFDLSPENSGFIHAVMTIILFLVDTSASMNQRTYLGTALIDVAKAAVESFMKVNRFFDVETKRQGLNKQTRL